MHFPLILGSLRNVEYPLHGRDVDQLLVKLVREALYVHAVDVEIWADGVQTLGSGVAVRYVYGV